LSRLSVDDDFFPALPQRAEPITARATSLHLRCIFRRRETAYCNASLMQFVWDGIGESIIGDLLTLGAKPNA
jgi:hypothetical protein